MTNGFAWEWRVLRTLQRRRTPFWDAVMPVISLLDNNGYLWVAVAFAMLFFRAHRSGGVLLLAALLGGVLIGNLLLKNLFARPRPCWLDEQVPLLIPVPRDYSFPSCHTLSSAAAVTLLMLEARWMGWIAIPLALLIAFSRLYLYVHFPTDILAGLACGVGIGFAAWQWLRPVLLHLSWLRA